MAHAAPTPPGTRRRNRVIGAALVIVGVVVLAIALISLRHPHGREVGDSTQPASTATHTITKSPTHPPSSPSSSPTHKSSASSSSSSSSHKSTKPATPRASVYILNNTNRQHLAADVEGQLKAKGWNVLAIENYSNEIISTCAYYDPSNAANKAAAEELQKEFPGIKRVAERFPQLPQAPIVLILDDDYP